MEQYAAYIPEKKKGFYLDARTKLLFMILISTLLFTAQGNTIFVCVLAAIPLILLEINGQTKTGIVYGMLFVLGVIADHYKGTFELPMVLNAISVLLISLVMHLFPTFMMGEYIIMSTKADEFVTSMERWHVSKKILIPIAVVFRFVPTMKEEAHSITEAMRMREIRFGTKKFWYSPGALLEYRMIPLMISVVKIGDELSASALTRGLGRTEKRSSIANVGFTKYDFVIGLISVLLLIWFTLGLRR